jgi:tagaturonate reductase
MDDALLYNFIRKTIFDEIIPTLDLEQSELENFAEDVLDRFKNPYIKHMLMSISLNSHSKYLTRIFPSVEAYSQRKGELPERLVFGLAALIQLFRDVDGKLQGQLKDNPEVLEVYQQLKSEEDYEKIVETVFTIESIWGNKLSTLEGLKNKTAKYLKAIDSKGVKACLSEII